MKILIRLSGYVLQRKLRLVVTYFSVTGAVVTAVVVPRLLGNAIDEALANGIRSQLLVLAGGIILISVLRGLFAYGQTYLAEAISQRAAYDLRNDFFEKLQALSFGFHDRQQTGNLMSRATQDVEASRFFMNMGLVRGPQLIFMFWAVAALLLFTNWRLGLVSLAFVPFMIWRAVVMAQKLRATWTHVQEETGHMTTVLQENLTGIRLVKAFSAGEHEQAKFEAKATAVANHSYSASLMFASQGSLMTLIFTVAMGATLWFGGRELAADRLTPGDLAAFILYMGILQMPVRMTGWLVNTFSRAVSAGQRIFEILDAVSPVRDKPGALRLTRVRGYVKFKHVSLKYDSFSQSVRNINFEVEPGQLVAILGGPGSGKSTVVHLIPRFYEVLDGRITIDGTDIRDVTIASLRRNIGIVLQDVFVFAMSLRDNIAYGVDDASSYDIERAARVAQLHDFIESLPNKYETQVGERGVTLSGGQRQRLAIARTILLDPPILIMDDSTSSVDMGTEHLIQRALSEVVVGRTTFVIAHRLSTVRQADLILVLDGGELVERGSHQDLLDQNGFYRKIYDLQLNPQEEPLSDSAFMIHGSEA